jgi:hypothetical protein
VPTSPISVYRLNRKIVIYRSREEEDGNSVERNSANECLDSFLGTFLKKNNKMLANYSPKNFLTASNTLLSAVRNASKKTGGSTKNPIDPHGK